MLLRLRRRPAAVTVIRPLAWELPYAAGADLKRQKDQKKKKKVEHEFRSSRCGSAEANPASIHKDVGSIPGLA